MYECNDCGAKFESHRQLNGHKSTHRVGGRYSKSRRKKPLNDCKNCGIKTKNESYCSNKCQHEWNFKTNKVPAMIELGRDNIISGPIRKYLLEIHGHGCSECKNTTWMGKSIPLDLDHIDGDPTNNSIENLRYLCPNCHRQTETWGMKKHRRELRTMGQLGRRCLDMAKTDGSIPSSSTT